jgi:hypothetical protein
MSRDLHHVQSTEVNGGAMDADFEDGRDPQEETAAQPRLSDPPLEELQLVEVRENPDWWRGNPGVHSEVH